MKIINDFSYYKGKISNCGHDERGGGRNGVAGDQTGTEWYIRSYWNDNWDCVIRFEDRKIANTIATLGILAAQNNKIGYDMNQRTTYWTQLEKSNYDPSKIKVNCESDCSCGVLSNVKAALILCGRKKSADKVNINGYTGNMKSILMNCGEKVKVFTTASYRTGTAYLLPGDILLNESKHTATNLGVGSQAKVVSNTYKAGKNPCYSLQEALNNSYTECQLKISGSYNLATRNSVKKHILEKGDVSYHVQWLQEALNKLGYKLEIDKSYGPLVMAAVCDYQSKHKWKITGTCGKKVTKQLIKDIRKINKKK